MAQVPIKPLESNVLVPNLKDYAKSPVPIQPLSPQAFTDNLFARLDAHSQAKRVQQQTDLEIQNSRNHQARVNAILKDAYASFTGSSTHIEYELKGHDAPGRERFAGALQEIRNMLEGKTTPNLKRAVFLSESAFDSSIEWADFSSEIDRMVRHLGFKMQQDKVDPSDAIAKNLTLFQFFTDTLEVNYTGFEKPVVSYPMFYDFEDFWGQQDIRSVYVSKLLKTGTGQCHSLPLLYLILAEEIGANAHLAFSPSHSYIKFQDNSGNWHNIELTNQMLTSDQFIMYSGYVKAEALTNRLYMNPLSTKEVIAQSLNDLAMSYISKFGYDDFVKACTNLAWKHGLKSMSIHKLNFNYYLAKHTQVLNQYKQYGLTKEDFEADEQAMRIYQNLIGAQKHIEKLGYADMPAEQYQKWLNSVKEESRKQEHRNKMRTLMGRIGQN